MDITFKTGKYKGRSVKSMHADQEIGYLYFLYWEIFRNNHNAPASEFRIAVRDKLFKEQKYVFDLVISARNQILDPQIINNPSWINKMIKDEIVYNKKYVLKRIQLGPIPLYDAVQLKNISSKMYGLLNDFKTHNRDARTALFLGPNVFKRKMMVEKFKEKLIENYVDINGVFFQLNDLPF